MTQSHVFEVHGRRVECVSSASYNAGYTGRNQKNLEAHITELARQGIQAPRQVPTLFSVASYMNLQVETVEVEHHKTTGEVEWALIYQGPTAPTLLTVASDHTDRALETHDITSSKQICPNILGTQAWDLEEVSDDVESIIMRSRVLDDGKWILLQEGVMGDLISPFEWQERLKELNRLKPGIILLGGTVPMIQPEAQFANQWEVSLTRPNGETITKNYTIDYMQTSIF